MTKEILDTTNKLVTPEDIPESDNDVIRQLSENLQNITPEDVDGMCKEMDEIKKIEEEQNIKILCSIDGSYVIYDKETGIVRWNGLCFQVEGFVGFGDFMREAIVAGTKPEQLTKIIRALGY